MGGYDPDLVGDLEARLLAVERRTMAMDGDLRTLRRGMVEAQQRIRDAWADRRLPTGAVAATPICVNDFSAICPCIPTTLTLVDSYYTTSLGGPTVPLVWDNLNSWRGCAIWTRPNDLACAGPVTFALHYALTGDNTTSSWVLTTQYKATNLSTFCPVASVCADATNVSHTSTTTFRCTGTSTWNVSGFTAGTQAWPASTAVSLKITL